MAEPVVDLLEVVEVDDDQRQRAVVAAGTGDLALERLMEEPPVVHAGERVEVGELPRLAEAPRVLDRRRGALGELLEPVQLVRAEPVAALAAVDGQEAEPARCCRPAARRGRGGSAARPPAVRLRGRRRRRSGTRARSNGAPRPRARAGRRAAARSTRRAAPRRRGSAGRPASPARSGPRRRRAGAARPRASASSTSSRSTDSATSSRNGRQRRSSSAWPVASARSRANSSRRASSREVSAGDALALAPPGAPPDAHDQDDQRGSTTEPRGAGDDREHRMAQNQPAEQQLTDGHLAGSMPTTAPPTAGAARQKKSGCHVLGWLRGSPDP